MPARRVIDRCREIAQYTEEPGHITRTYLSPPMHGVHELLSRWMRDAGCDVSVDAVGNLRGIYPARTANAPRLIIASHLDTVPHGGAFDGVLGVVLGVALLESLQGRRLAVEIEVIGFSEEEGVRFGTCFIGSRALVGTIDDGLLQRIRRAIVEFGLDPAGIPDAKLRGDVAGYLEFHIEQGPVLESLDLSLGIVEAIVGQTRAIVEFQGKANHAGTTPMHLRRDAVATAAEWIAALEQIARNTPGLVATVGGMTVEPNVSNVIAGRAAATLDIRHAVDAVRCDAVNRAFASAFDIAARRGLQCATRMVQDHPGVAMDTELTALVERSVRAAGHATFRMMSGAGHDAMVVAAHFPAAMLFLRSPGGISHHPDETVQEKDIAAALAAGQKILERWS
jgi:allantoate deiminase